MGDLCKDEAKKIRNEWKSAEALEETAAAAKRAAERAAAMAESAATTAAAAAADTMAGAVPPTATATAKADVTIEHNSTTCSCRHSGVRMNGMNKIWG